MMNLSGYRPFSIAALPHGASIDSGPQLINACQIRHLGFVQGTLGNAGAMELAKWIIAHRSYIDAPKPGTHPLNSGTAIERILAGEILPEEAFAIDIAEATEGAVLPEMFGRPATELLSSALTSSPQGADAKEPATGSPPDRAPVPSSSNVVPLPDGLPALSALGGALAPGRLFHPIADARFPEGFVLTGCGIMLCLDASTASAMRQAIDDGLAHVESIRNARTRLAA